MLQRTVSYKSLLRFVGWCFLLYGTYLIVLALTSQSTMNNNTSPWIFEDPIGVRNYLLYGGPLMANPLLPVPLNSFLTPGPLFWVSISMLCLSLTSMHVHVVYICLHIALWLISLSVWFPIFFLFGFTDYDLSNFMPLVLITLACSLILLTLYKPVTASLEQVFCIK